MKILKILFFSLLFFALTNQSFAQYGYENQLAICERYYEDGDYNRAVQECVPIIAKMKKESKGLVVVKLQMYLAKYYEGAGRYIAFEEMLKECLKNKATARTTEQMPYMAFANLDAANLYLIYGATNEAEKYFNIAKEMLGLSISAQGDLSKSYQDASINAQILYVQARIFYDRGQIDEFLKIIDRVEEAHQKRIKEEEEYYEEITNDYRQRKLSFIEQKRRKTDYAQILTLHADALRIKGDFANTEKILQKADEWIKQNINNRELAHIRNQHIRSLLCLDSGINAERNRKMIEDNLYLAEQTLTTVHKDYSKIEHTLVEYYIENRYLTKSSIQRWEYRENASKYYGKNSTQYAIYLRTEGKSKLYDQAYLRSVDDHLKTIGSDSKKVPLNHIERIRTLQLAYNSALEENQYQKALMYLNDMLSSAERILGNNSLQYLYKLMQAANYYDTYTNKFSKSDSIYQSVFYGQLCKRITVDNPHYLEGLYQITDYYETLERYDSANNIIKRILDISERRFGKNSPQYGAAIDKFIRFEMSQGRYNQADSLINQSLAIFDKQSDAKVFGEQNSKALQTAANFYAILGLYDQSRDFLRKADRISVSNASASNPDELAYLYIKTDEFDKAKKIVDQAIIERLERYGETSRYLIGTYNQAARLNIALGEYSKADDYVKKSLEISQATFGETSLRNVEGIIVNAELNNSIGDYDKAISEMNKAIKILEKGFGRNHIQVATALAQLARFKINKGEDLAGTESLLNEAEQIIEKNLGKNNPIYADELFSLGRFYLADNKLDRAKDLLNQANEFWKNTLGDRNTQSAEIELFLGDLEVKKRNFDQAEQIYKKTQEVIRKLKGKTHEDNIKVYSRLAKMFYIKNDLKKSQENIELALAQYKNYIRDFFPALSDQEKNKYASKIKSDFEFHTNLMMRMSKDKAEFLGEIYDNVLLTKSLLLNSSIKVRQSILSSGNDSLIRNYEKWQKQKEYLIKVIGMNAEQQKQEGVDPRKLQNVIEDLEKQLSRQSDAFKESEGKQIQWQQIKSLLKENEFAVEIIRYRYFDTNFTDSVIYAALLLDPKKSNPILVSLTSGADLEEKAFKYYRNMMIYNRIDMESYKKYWEAFDKFLPKNAKIYLSVAGVYSQINIESLLKKDKRFVIDDANIVLVGSTGNLVENSIIFNKNLKLSNKTTEVVLIGNPLFYHDLPKEEWDLITQKPITQLPGTKKEVSILDSLLNGKAKIRLLTNDAAKEDLILKIKSPRILHISTHGFFEPNIEDSKADELGGQKVVNNPLLRSGVLLANAGDMMAGGNVYNYNKDYGVLTAFEVANMNLDGTELVVLSACETGRGDLKVGDGVAGLQRSFLVAGTKNVIMTLFKVDDNATQELMVLFYKEWFKTGDKRLAFSNAKKELRKQERFSKPKYWSPFVMIGLE
ncbi:MAG: CHAT domain-containing protein [Bacteroidetes bacterium]|nr:MAG: CHAT domain-containing protein [Bacteroidota bacterium]